MYITNSEHSTMQAMLNHSVQKQMTQQISNAIIIYCMDVLYAYAHIPFRDKHVTLFPIAIDGQDKTVD